MDEITGWDNCWQPSLFLFRLF